MYSLTLFYIVIPIFYRSSPESVVISDNVARVNMNKQENLAAFVMGASFSCVSSLTKPIDLFVTMRICYPSFIDRSDCRAREYL